MITGTMPSERELDDTRAKAQELVTASAAAVSDVSVDERQTLVDALARDLLAASNLADAEEERLVKIETQTRVLAEAVIAITATSDAVAPAVQAVKDEM
jgi:hypothetical protein